MDDADTPALDNAAETGQEIYEAMESWRLGLGDLYSEIGPVGRDGRTATLGINLVGRNIIKRSWYWGGLETPDVLVDVPLQDGPSENWPTIITESVPMSPIWPWLTSRRILAESLTRTLEEKRLALVSDLALHELAWEFSLIGNLGGDQEKLLRVIREILQGLPLGSAGFEFRARSGDKIQLTAEDLRRMERFLCEFAGRSDRSISEPWALAGQSMKAGWRWEVYSREQLLRRTNSVYSSALRIYEGMSEHWFGNFCNRLRLYQLLPVRLEGTLTFPRDNDDIRLGPKLTWRSRSLQAGEESVAAFTLNDQGWTFLDNESYFADEASRLKILRPQSEVEYSLSVVHTVLDVFGFLPSTELAIKWISEDLREVGWSNR